MASAYDKQPPKLIQINQSTEVYLKRYPRRSSSTTIDWQRDKDDDNAVVEKEHNKDQGRNGNQAMNLFT